jgi:hypothetical protein
MSRIENSVDKINWTPYESGIDIIEPQTGNSASTDIREKTSFFHSNLNRFALKSTQGRLQNRSRAKKHLDLATYKLKISTQYESYKDLYVDVSFEEIWKTSSEVIFKLLSHKPTGFSAELTSELSIFYTFKKHNNTLYLQYYFESEENGFNTTLVEYIGDEKKNSTHGNLNEILTQIDLIMS